MKNTAIVALILACTFILISALVATGVIQDLIYPVPAGSPGTVSPDRATFIADAVSTDTEVVFLIVPRTATEQDYVISYRILRDMVPIDSADARLYPNLSRSHPFMKRLPKDPSSTYSLSVEIHGTDGTLFYQGTLKSPSERPRERNNSPSP